MKVFLSWSGDLSHKVSVILRDWIPSVIQSVESYVSSEDIDKGARWSSDIAKELEKSLYGIICVTSENIDAPWLNFEAGALSKAFDKSNVSPFLFDVKRSEIKGGPILQFQSTIFSKDDIRKLVKGINKACEENCLEETRLDKVFEVWWPKLEEEFNSLKEKGTKHKKKEKENIKEESASAEILEELLELVRTQHKLLRSPENLLPPSYLERIVKSTDPIQSINPNALSELAYLWDKFVSRITSFKDEDVIPKLTLIEDIDHLSPLIKYITQRRPRRRLISRKLVKKEDDDI